MKTKTLCKLQSLPKESYLESFLPILMKVSGLCNSLHENVKMSALNLSKNLYRELFCWAQTQNKDSLVNNTLLVNLGLIKSEDKKFVPAWDIDACLVALEATITESFFPSNTKQTLQLFLGRKTNVVGTGHKKLLETLSNHSF